MEILKHGEKKKYCILKKKFRILAIFFYFMQIVNGALTTNKKQIRYFSDLSAPDSTSTYFTAAGHQRPFLIVTSVDLCKTKKKGGGVVLFFLFFFFKNSRPTVLN